VYYAKGSEDAVNDFISHLQNIHAALKDKDVLVTIAMDGENAWEYYKNDGIDFLKKLYQKLSESPFVKTTTVGDYLKSHPPVKEIKRLAAGSWIFSDFGKWIGSPHKVLGWEILAEARKDLQRILADGKNAVSEENLKLIFKQMYILEGSDWFWWLGEDPEGAFDKLFRAHLTNFYTLINKNPPDYLNKRLQP
jgi:alpha-amylase/alpha-mannosidase (GH57 family)